MKKFDFKSAFPHLIAVAVISALVIVYFLPQLSGKNLPMGDIVQYQKMAKEANDFNKTASEPTLWTNSMFGGFPTYQLNAPMSGNKLSSVMGLSYLGFQRPIGYFISAGLIFYLSLVLLGLSPWVSLIASLFYAFCTNNIVLFEAGHASKINVLNCIVPLISSLILLYRGKYLTGGLLFSIFLGLNVFNNHYQMTYYAALILVPLGLVLAGKLIKEKKFKSLAIIVSVLGLGSLLGIGSSANRLMTTFEYTKHTMRGVQILTPRDSTGKIAKVASTMNNTGLEYDYAMQWSNGLGDVLAGVVPQIVGGGSQELADKKSDFVKAIGRNEDTPIPSYHGSLPFTSGPVYFGALVVFLCIFSLIAVRNYVSWWVFGAILFTVLISMGKNFGILNELLFNHLPYFNKFRSHTSITGLTTIVVAFGAAFGLDQLLKLENKASLLKPLKIVGGVFLVFFAGLYLLGDSFFDFQNAADSQYEPQMASLLVQERLNMLQSSSLRSLFFVLVGVVTLWLWIKDKLKANIVLAILGVFGVLDLWLVDKNYINKDSFVRQDLVAQNLEPRPVDLEILKDTDKYYRVYDATINTFNDATASAFHKTVGGYSPVKLRRIQDIIDQHISKNNMRVLHILNTKYFIVPGQNNSPTIQQNPEALGNAWFVDKITLVPNADAESDSLARFNPVSNAIVHDEFKAYISGLNLQKNGEIKLTDYKPNSLSYTSNTTSEQFAVFSDIWYGPNLGWEASIDGKPVEHIRANYLLRGMKIPAGKHDINFEFKPKTFATGEAISKYSSLALMALALVGVVLGVVKRK